MKRIAWWRDKLPLNLAQRWRFIVVRVKHAVRHGIKGAWPVWCILGALCICGIVFRFISASEPTIRWAGMSLQILGFVLALWDLLSISKLFQIPMGIEAVRNYFRGFKLRGAVIDFAPATMHLSVGDARISVSRNPNANLDVRMAKAEEQIDDLVTMAEELSRKQKENARQFRYELQDQARVLREETGDISKRLRSAVAGGLALQVVGVFYFVFGVFMASTSFELAAWLS